MRVLIVGDTHGNADWLRRYIFPVALTIEADAIVILGDFGAWEHTPDGVVFMDEVGDLCADAEIPLYWLHGNHDKWSHTVENYKTNSRGFFVCRERVFYIPQGHTWKWGGVSFRVFGGAYSVDKAWRVQREQERYLSKLRQAQYQHQKTGVTHEVIPSQNGTLWFPEEEMTEAEMDELLERDSETKQVILSHDKPLSAKPPWNRKDLPGCMANQIRLERALRAHQPQWWFHGHLHYSYQQKVSGRSWQTMVVGLEPDDDAAEPGWKRANTWAVADCENGQLTVKLGHQTFLDAEIMQEHVAKLG